MSSKHKQQSVDVYADIAHLGTEPRRMGSLHSQKSRAGDVFSFEYSAEWLQAPNAFTLDPDLSLAGGPQYAPRANFGIFLDSSPDRWGRLLQQRRENMRAHREQRRPRALTDWDFLLGVDDETRLGALRFQDPETGRFMDSSDDGLAAPPITSIRELQAASLQFEKHGDEVDHPDYEHWLRQLFAPGSSLGGARPKASVQDETGHLCLAKFPSKQDRRDVGAWELTAIRLAARAGIAVPLTRAIRVPDSAYTTFVARRFDRTAKGTRLAFVSAMTLTQRSDGEPGGSYLELVDVLQSRGTNSRQDCAELFRRVVFNILIHNTDDHLRNHGFLLGEQGLTLSPVYDINPSVDQDDLSLAIDEVETRCDVAIALDAHAAYGLTKSEAERIVAKTTAAVRNWRTEAKRLGIPKAEQELMAPAFEKA